MYLTTVVPVGHCILRSEECLFSFPTSDAGYAQILFFFLQTRKCLEYWYHHQGNYVYEILKNGVSFVFSGGRPFRQ